ncbi:MAG: type II secretion system protein [Planctomycetota bacterium]
MRRRGFTLLEIVLAIGLSGAVIALLTTAIDLYLVRVDASRNQVETAQLARTLLNRIATDIQAARYLAPDESDNEGDGLAAVSGIYGTAGELRIDRSSIPRWDWIVAQNASGDDAASTTDEPIDQHMPQTVRYLLGDGRELLSTELAAKGVSEQSLEQGYAGLYREQLSTAAWLEQTADGSGLATDSEMSNAALFAPEVVRIEFVYFNGTELLTDWDTSSEQALPTAIEVRLTLLKVPFVREESDPIGGRDELRRKQENLVEYRRFVKLPEIEEPYEAEFAQQATAAGEDGLP